MSVGAHVGEQVHAVRFEAEGPNVVGCERALAQTDGQWAGQREDGKPDELAARHVFR